MGVYHILTPTYGGMKGIIVRQIKLIIDNAIVEKYFQYYFNQYPRRKKKPILQPFPPSLNKFIAMKRMQQNDLKKKYKEFSMWLASYYKIANLKLDKLEITYTFYFPNHIRRDMDNLLLTPKFFNDGFVESQVMIDDSGDMLQIVFDSFRYEKDNPRVEITIKNKKENGRVTNAKKNIS